MKKFQKDILLVFITLFTISLIIFSILSYLNWSLITGFILGVSISIISYLINELFFAKLLSKRRKFYFIFLLTILKSVIWLLVFASTFIGILFANNLLKNTWTDGIFNIFTFIYGSTCVMISIIINNFIEIIRNKIKKIGRRDV